MNSSLDSQSHNNNNHTITTTNQPTNHHQIKNLTIRFAPLPDPRALRDHQDDIWWSREEKPDGTWGDYRLMVKTKDGQIIPLNDLNKNSLEFKEILNQINSKNSSSSSNLIQIISKDLNNHHLNNNNHNHNQINSNNKIDSNLNLNQSNLLSKSNSNLSDLLTNQIQNQVNNNLTSNSSIIINHHQNQNSLSLFRTLSRESSNSLTQSNHNTIDSNQIKKDSLKKKILDTLSKPLKKNSNQLTSTNSLPIQNSSCHPNYSIDNSLYKTSSVDSNKFNHSNWFKKSYQNFSLRKSISKDDLIHQSLNHHHFNLENSLTRPNLKRRSNYPPVAQRKVQMGGSRGGAGKVLTSIKEPEFVEWRPIASNFINSSTSIEEDDGSGLAWLKKRQRERQLRDHQNQTQKIESSNNLSTNLQSNPHQSNSLNHLPWNNQPDHDNKPSSINSSSSSSSSSCSQNGDLPSNGTRTSASLTSEDNKDSSSNDNQDDLDDEELKEEERLKALTIAKSPFVRGATEVYRDREHHQSFKAS